MFSSFFATKKWTVWAYLGTFVLLYSLYIQTTYNVAINDWYKDFYDMLQRAKEHKIDDFWDSIIKFCFIAFPYILIVTLTNYFTRIWAFKWREAMTFDYINFWKNTKKDIEGSSQRIQEDIYRFAKIVESLGLQVVKAIMKLIAFIPILWGLSSGVEIPYLKDIPGSLVWVALIVSIGGLLISWFVGIMLPGLEYNNQKVEAAFRKELVYAEDDKSNYARPETLIELFTGLKFNYHRLFLHYGYFDIWITFFSQLMIIVPLLIIGPGLFTGIITLGIMMQVNNAFSQVRNSFSVFINNWTTITELRSIHKRLGEFQKNIGYKNDIERTKIKLKHAILFRNLAFIAFALYFAFSKYKLEKLLIDNALVLGILFISISVVVELWSSISLKKEYNNTKIPLLFLGKFAFFVTVIFAVYDTKLLFLLIPYLIFLFLYIKELVKSLKLSMKKVCLIYFLAILK